MGTRTLRASIKELPARGRKRLRDGLHRNFRILAVVASSCLSIRTFFPAELTVRIACCRRVTHFFDSVMATENARFILPEAINDFLAAPDIVRALGVLGTAMSKQTIGILCGEKTSLRMGHVPQHVIESLASDVREKFVMRELPSLDKRDRELGLIIEHFLEMRDMPELINRIPVKASSEMITHASRSHPAQGEECHRRRRDLHRHPTPASQIEAES